MSCDVHHLHVLLQTVAPAPWVEMGLAVATEIVVMAEVVASAGGGGYLD